MNAPRPRLSFVASAFVVLLLLTACGSSTPTNYYTLASSSPAGGDGATMRTAAVVALGPVQLPDYVDRPQIVVRETDFRLRLAADDLWAAPLADMVPRVLVDNLGRRLPGARVVAFPQVAGPSSDYRVAVDISRFDVDADGTASISARWQVYETGTPRALVVEESMLQRPGDGSGYPAAVAALSGGLAELSDRIAEALLTLRPPPARPVALGR